MQKKAAVLVLTMILVLGMPICAQAFNYTDDTAGFSIDIPEGSRIYYYTPNGTNMSGELLQKAEQEAVNLMIGSYNEEGYLGYSLKVTAVNGETTPEDQLTQMRDSMVADYTFDEAFASETVAGATASVLRGKSSKDGAYSICVYALSNDTLTYTVPIIYKDVPGDEYLNSAIAVLNTLNLSAPIPGNEANGGAEPQAQPPAGDTTPTDQAGTLNDQQGQDISGAGSGTQGETGTFQSETVNLEKPESTVLYDNSFLGQLGRFFRQDIVVIILTVILILLIILMIVKVTRIKSHRQVKRVNAREESKADEAEVPSMETFLEDMNRERSGKAPKTPVVSSHMTHDGASRQEQHPKATLVSHSEETDSGKPVPVPAQPVEKVQVNRPVQARRVVQVSETVSTPERVSSQPVETVNVQPVQARRVQPAAQMNQKTPSAQPMATDYRRPSSVQANENRNQIQVDYGNDSIISQESVDRGKSLKDKDMEILRRYIISKDYGMAFQKISDIYLCLDYDLTEDEKKKLAALLSMIKKY